MSDKFIETLMKAAEAEKMKDCAEAGQMSLGELKATLAACDEDKPVRLEGGSGVGPLDSYRGYYSDIAIEPHGESTVGELLEAVTAAIGKTFYGYKGGDFVMSKMTPVWISGYGTASGLRLVEVVDEPDHVELVTKKEVWE